MPHLSLLASVFLLLGALLVPGSVCAEESIAADPVLEALQLELERSIQLLSEQPQKPYFIGLEVIEAQSVNIRGEEGGLHGYTPSVRRWIHADIRLGEPKMDSTHPLRESDADYTSSGRSMGLGDDVGVLRRYIWSEVEKSYRESRERMQQVEADQQVLVEEENRAWDLAPTEVVTDIQERPSLAGLNLQEIEDAVREASAVFSAATTALDPSVGLSGEAVTQWYVSSEGHSLRHGTTRFRMGVTADAIAPDGDHIQLFEAIDTASVDGLPDAAAMLAAASSLEKRLVALRAAPREEPYSGPAILSGRAAAVFFHEIFGHRVEGSRLKQVDSGQTFLNKVGEAILPPFLSVHDDPTIPQVNGIDLRGAYAYDNQGVRSSRVTLVDRGVLEGFLESRSPSTEGKVSNAHGRRQAGRAVVARQGNLVITAHKQIPEGQLRERLRSLAKKQGLDYGLYIEDISGGFTFTGTYMPNAYQINVLLAHRIYVDGRPDELVRGIDFIGTPLQTFSKIVAAGEQVEVFNGSCGAESGWVPVSAAAPSMLLTQVEAQRQMKGQAKPPLLEPPSPTVVEEGADRLLAQMATAADRANSRLRLAGAPPPAWTEVVARDLDRHSVTADFGSLRHSSGARSRPATLEVVVGDERLNSSRITGGSVATLPGAAIEASLVVEDLGENAPRDLWLIADHSYKAALQRYAFKASTRALVVGEEPPPDLSSVPVTTHLAGVAAEPIPRARLDQLAVGASEKLRGLGLLTGSVTARTIRGNEYLVRSDGTKIIQPYGYTAVWASASAVRADGLRISDYRQWLARSEDELPSLDEIGVEVRSMGERLQERILADVMPYYEGPVLFEGLAATQLFVQLLAPSLRGTPPRPEPGRSYQQQTRRGPRLHRQVLPSGWHVSDDPKRSHPTLPGGFEFDQEGVRAEQVELVRDGRVVNFVMSRVPRPEVSASNGHARGGVGGERSGRLANWTVAPPRGLSPVAMKRALVRAQRAAGTDRVLVIRRLGFSSQGRLGRPTQALWRYADGREEPVLLLEFLGIDRRSLRDVAAVSGGNQTLGYLGSVSPRGQLGTTSGIPMIVTTPTQVLVEHLELAYPGSSQKPFAIEPPALESP